MRYLLLSGLLLNVLILVWYFLRGYDNLVLVFWLGSLILTGLSFFNGRSEIRFSFQKSDLLAIISLVLLFAPLYLFNLYNWPVQMSTDEIVIMSTTKEVMAKPQPFALSNYFNFPALVFLIYGSVGKFLGGIDLTHMRTVHALFGLSIILLSYLFFRLVIPNGKVLIALAAAVILGINHSLVAISRLAMRENSALLVEILSLIFLYIGFTKRANLSLYLGGLALGLSMYVYMPGKITLFIWLLFLLLMYFLKKVDVKFILKSGLISLLGFILFIGPLGITMIKSTTGNDSTWVKEHLLIFPQAQENQRKWIFAPTILDGLKINFLNGITAFNNQIVDNNYVYINYRHGFLDPLTGILIWIGMVVVVFKRQKQASDWLILAGFFLTWFTLALLFDKNPHYGRLLITLPFISYLVVIGLDRLVKKRLIFLLLMVTIIIWNLVILKDYLIYGIKNGNDVGGTARFVEARKNIPSYSFYLVYNQNYPYYSYPGTWHNFFIGDKQKAETLSPENFVGSLKRPFTVFMSKPLWLKSQPAFMAKYPLFQIHNIKPDGSLVAIEVN